LMVKMNTSMYNTIHLSYPVRKLFYDLKDNRAKSTWTKKE